MKTIQCWYCIHYLSDSKNQLPSCAAFPDGIPEQILIGKFNHIKPYKGDNGITYKPRTLLQGFEREGLI